MTLLAYFLRTAVHNLLRGGQRALVALLCVAFGVMSVVSMLLVSGAIERLMLIEPQYMIGADVTMDRVQEDKIFPDHIAGLQALQQAGKIDQFTVVAYSSSLVYRLPGSGELHFPSAGMGIDPSNYPLIGAFTFHPAGSSLSSLLQEPGDVLIARDMVDEGGLRLGDTLLLSDLSTGTVVEARVQGIVTGTPNNQGNKIYYSLETARLLAGDTNPENTALATTSNPQAAISALENLGWRAYTAQWLADGEKQVEEMFKLSFKGSGILGLMVGGIGIANTMQVLLKRRRREVAVLKTLGYRQDQLQVMFAIEAALLGLFGSLLGAGLGIAISYGLVILLSRITDLLITWTFSPLPVLTGILVGIITTVSFAMFAIVITSRVRPLAVMRSEALASSQIPWFQSLGLALLCSLPFIAITVLVMGSFLAGIGVLLLALGGLCGLGLFMAGLVWFLTCLLPLRAWPLVHMARNNLRRRGLALVFAMVALFIGVVSLGMGVVVTSSAQRALDVRMIKFTGDNLMIIAPSDQEDAIRQTLEKNSGSIEHIAHSYLTPVRSITVEGEPETNISPELMGQSKLTDLTIKGAPWESQPDGVYTFGFDNITPGSKVQVTLLDGSVQVLPVVGSYSFNQQVATPRLTGGLLLPASLSLKLAPPETVQFFLTAPASQVEQVSAALGAALPNSTVINLPAYAVRFTQAYLNLFIFAVSMAGLALLAGVLLVANSVSLAMLDRRYEIGVLKAIGYARRQVLFTLVVEYSLVALIASASGLLSVQFLLWITALLNSLAGSLLVMDPGAAAIILLVSVGLTLLTVLGVTWRPVQVSPVVILNDRE